MGAVPSRETLRRGLYVVRPSTGSGSQGGSKKQEIVLIPLTKEFFPSPDCALFVQFHKARCDAGVNYYFRRPGNPGDLSTIPVTGNIEGDSSYPSREALYHGVVERMEEMLFDTDEEMRLAHECATSGAPGDVKKKVLPIMCAVAFRHDPAKLLQQQQGNSNTGNTPHLHVLMEQGVFLCGSIVNIVGLFGFVPMELEGVQVASASNASHSLPSYGSQTHRSSNPPLLSSLRDGSTPFPLMSFPVQSSYDRHEDPTALPGYSQNLGAHSMSGGGSSVASPPSYDPYKQRPNADIAQKARLIHLRHASNSNYDHFVSLPPPVAAPLAAIVFLTKSAGEQNLSRVTFIAASTYYNQLTEAGVLQRHTARGGQSPGHARTHMPPMDTFSFSSLMTNIPILSFVHEMRCRLEHAGLVSKPGSEHCSPSNSLRCPSLNAPKGSSGFSLYSPHEDFEMWITDDSMFHGRIGKSLAEQICCVLAEQPELTGRRADPLPTEDTYWRFRGLVDRNRPPPSPSGENGRTPVDKLDVYVMGAAVMEGFDEGDVLRFDWESHLWVADRSIPLDTVVLAAMRPHCRTAREAPPDDPGWVTVPQVGEDQGQEQPEGNNEGRVHVREGNFYIYRFQMNGKVYYHGTVPDFANPNKNKLQQAHSASERLTSSVVDQKVPRLQLSKDLPMQQPEEEKAAKVTGRRPPSITTALFSLTPDALNDDEQVGVKAYLPTRVKSVAIDTAKRWMGTLFHYAMGRRAAGDVAGGGAPATSGAFSCTSTPLVSSGASTPMARRKPTFVQVGPDAGHTVELPKKGIEEGKGFVKRFVQDTRYVWDWRKS